MTTGFRNTLALVLLLAAVGPACAPTPGVRTVPSAGVERIPADIAVHALLGNATRTSFHRAIDPLADRAQRRVHLVPPTESELAVTPASQMLTGELTARLLHHGFTLRELPCEVLEDQGPHGRDAYVISLDLLEDLRERHGLEAVLVGNAFFAGGIGGGPRGLRVVAAYLKLVDTRTLEVLCQVSLPYEEYGRELHEVADVLARDLAALADLDG